MEENHVELTRLQIERERLELDKRTAEANKKFFRAHAGVLITSVVSLAAIIVSISQVWVTKLSKDKELEIAFIQKKSELDLQDAQKRREWELNAAKFITENRKAIFNGTPEEQRLFARIISSIYPPEISSSILTRIEKTSPPATKGTWNEARTSIGSSQPSFRERESQALFSPDKKYYLKVNGLSPLLFKVATEEIVIAYMNSPPLGPFDSVFFSPDSTFVELKSGDAAVRFVFGNPPLVTTTDLEPRANL